MGKIIKYEPSSRNIYAELNSRNQSSSTAPVCGSKEEEETNMGKNNDQHTKLIGKSQSSSAPICGSKEKETYMAKNNDQHAELSSKCQSSSAPICDPKEEEEEEEEEEEKTFVGCVLSFRLGFWKRKHSTQKFLFKNLPIMSPRPSRSVEVARYQNLWLFVFGTLQYSDNVVSGDVNKIHALHLSSNTWHDVDANFLKGRFMFSIVGICDGIFIVGGRSYNRNPGVFSSGKKTHKEVMFFNPVTQSCHNLHSMKYARCVPILGVTESPIIPFVRQRTNDHSNSSSEFKRSFLLIAVGGFDDDYRGTDDDPLRYSGEIYDSVTNKWTEIQSLPSNFGSPYSGIVCDKMFFVVSRTCKLAAYDIEKGFWSSIQTPSFGPNKPPYEPKLVSTNDRILLVSNRWPKIRQEMHNLVTTLWEFNLTRLTWTEIAIDPDAITNWKYVEFVASRNTIFGAKMVYPDSDEILDYFIECDVSGSNSAKWNDISSKVIYKSLGRDRPTLDPFWTRSIAVIDVSFWNSSRLFPMASK